MTIQGAIHDLDELIKDDDIPFYVKPSLEKIKETIFSEFSLPEKEKGEWIDDEFDPELYRCSKCHICWTKSEVDNFNMDFCPGCGADMRGE